MALDSLSATDRAFLSIESAEMGMHVGAVMLFEGGDLVGPDGALAMDLVHRRVAAALDGAPRLRQKVREVPGLGAVWVDDDRFRLDAHLFHTAVPRPGGMPQLFRLAGRLFAQPLDRRRPLWEMWFVEGLEGGRLALVMKAHHAMVDGVGGLELLASLLRVEPTTDVAEPSTFQPRPPPSARDVAVDRARTLVHAVDTFRKSLGEGGAGEKLRSVAAGLVETLKDGATPADETTLNPKEVGPHRAFAGIRLDLERLRALRRATGGTLNDLALAAVTGGLRAYLQRRGDPVGSLRTFRAMVPVNLRGRGLAGADGGNHVSLVLAKLPIDEPSPLARLAAVRATCEHLKHASHEIEGAAFVEHLADLGGPNVVTASFHAAMRLRAFNVVVSNVPGPPFGLYFGTARLAGLWGLVPLFAHQGLAISLVSYDGGFFVGLHADPDAVPDPERVGEDVAVAFDELEAAVAGA